jgi:hypothetical protein
MRGTKREKNKTAHNTEAAFSTDGEGCFFRFATGELEDGLVCRRKETNNNSCILTAVVSTAGFVHAGKDKYYRSFLFSFSFLLVGESSLIRTKKGDRRQRGGGRFKKEEAGAGALINFIFAEPIA